MTRSHVARLLGVHVTTVRRLERQGLLHPAGGAGERRHFEPTDVASLARRWTARNRLVVVSSSVRDRGRDAARAFEMFRRGAAFEDVVIALSLEPAEVRRLFAEWRAGFQSCEPLADGGPEAQPSEPILDDKGLGEILARLMQVK